MVSLQAVQQSNARIATLPHGLVAAFIGATSGIGRSALQQFAQHASSPRNYTVARPPTVACHEGLLASLRQSNPSGTYTLITADASLVSEIDQVVKTLKQNETKLDILFLPAGSMPFEGRRDTCEGLDPSMSTRHYTRPRAVQQLLRYAKPARHLRPARRARGPARPGRPGPARPAQLVVLERLRAFCHNGYAGA